MRSIPLKRNNSSSPVSRPKTPDSIPRWSRLRHHRPPIRISPTYKSVSQVSHFTTSSHPADIPIELEASLTLKVQEVDESDDRVREMYKTNAKLEKKAAKLQRQLTAATIATETASNTAANKAASAAVMGPPQLPVPSKVPPPAPIPAPVACTPRQPLRPVNVFEPMSQQTPSVVGAKRLREGEWDEKPLPAECIVLPPSVGSAKKPLVRTAFTPQRGNVFAHPHQTHSNTKSTITNAFARPPAPNVFQVHP